MADFPPRGGDPAIDRAGERRPRTLSADELLPPVEPPSAGFLVQLFVVPAVIVSIIVGIWLSFHWIAHLGQDPQAYLTTLRRNNAGRWQAALNLANDLRGPAAQALKSDAAMATELGRILDDETKSGRTGQESQMLRVYLCRALGEFSVPEATAPLVNRVADADPAVSRAAIEALAVLTTNLVAAGREPPGAEAAAAVVAASKSEDAGLRSAAAFTLGIVAGGGQGPGVDRLRTLLSDPADDVRYNAALALARLGDRVCTDTLEEMLGLPDEPAAAGPGATRQADDEAQSRRYKRALVVMNALRGLALLLDASGEPLPDAVLARVKELSADPVSDIRAGVAALETKLARLAPAG